MPPCTTCDGEGTAMAAGSAAICSLGLGGADGDACATSANSAANTHAKKTTMGSRVTDPPPFSGPL